MWSLVASIEKVSSYEGKWLQNSPAMPCEQTDHIELAWLWDNYMFNSNPGSNGRKDHT